MSSRLQLDVRNLSLGRRHLENVYEVKAGIGVIAGTTILLITVHKPCRLHRDITLTGLPFLTWHRLLVPGVPILGQYDTIHIASLEF